MIVIFLLGLPIVYVVMDGNCDHFILVRIGVSCIAVNDTKQTMRLILKFPEQSAHLAREPMSDPGLWAGPWPVHGKILVTLYRVLLVNLSEFGQLYQIMGPNHLCSSILEHHLDFACI